MIWNSLHEHKFCLYNTSVLNRIPISAAKDKGEKKLFGFAFTPLMREDGTTLSDECHELYVYKVRTFSPAH